MNNILCIILLVLATISQSQSNLILNLAESEQIEPIKKYKLSVTFPRSMQINYNQIKCMIDHEQSGKRAGLRKISNEGILNDRKTIYFDVIPLEHGQLIVCSLDGIESNGISFTGKTYSSYVIKFNAPFDVSGPEFAATIMDLIKPSIFEVSFAGEPNSLQAITTTLVNRDSLIEMQLKISKNYKTTILSSDLCKTESLFNFILKSTLIGNYTIPDKILLDEDENPIKIHCGGDYYTGGSWSNVDKKKLTNAIRSTIRITEKVHHIAKRMKEFGSNQAVDVRELSSVVRLIDDTVKNQKIVLRKLQQNNDTNQFLAMLDRKLLNVTGLPMAGFTTEVGKRIAIRVENLNVTRSVGLLALTDNVGNTSNIDSLLPLSNNDSGLIIQIIAAVRLPETLLKRSERALFTVHSHGQLFSTSFNTSAIVGVKLSGGPYENLQEPVRIYFRRDQEQRPHHGECVSWDFGLNDGYGDWSSAGCKFHKTHYDRNIKINDDGTRFEEPKFEGVVLDECWCYHLTYFGELFLDHSLPVNADRVPYYVISLVGVSLSLLLSLTAVVINAYAFPK